MTAEASAVVLWCSRCGGERSFEAVPCTEGHLDCPDRACVGCGAAVLLGGDAASAEVPVAAVA
ncbi:MAG TPA: hypothetical protein VFR74_04545 [Jiangellales bacterium]|nr:hypothetical protein [Jiangellales bacterium]